MIELFLIRHGETAWNAQRRLQGHLDISLNEIGVKQASALANAMQQYPLQAIICSDLQRAVQTAQSIAHTQALPYHTDPQFRERAFGDFEGKLIHTLEAQFPVEYTAWRAHETDAVFPPNSVGRTGESIRQFHQRIEQAFLQLTQQRSHQKIAIIAHGGVLECAYRMALKLPLNAPRQVSMLNASINRFELTSDGANVQLKLIEWGDVRHLNAALDEI